MTSPDPETSVTGYLSTDHDRLDQLFADADQRVMAGDFAGAAPILAQFASGLRRHIRLEDEVLFPTFERVTGMADGPVEVMRYEHRAIELHLEQMVAAVDERDRGAFVAEKVAMLGVLGDHNDKEEAIIYPLTDAHLPPDERVRLVASLRSFR